MRRAAASLWCLISLAVTLGPTRTVPARCSARGHTRSAPDASGLAHCYEKCSGSASVVRSLPTVDAVRRTLPSAVRSSTRTRTSSPPRWAPGRPSGRRWRPVGDGAGARRGSAASTGPVSADPTGLWPSTDGTGRSDRAGAHRWLGRCGSSVSGTVEEWPDDDIHGAACGSNMVWGQSPRAGHARHGRITDHRHPRSTGNGGNGPHVFCKQRP